MVNFEGFHFRFFNIFGIFSDLSSVKCIFASFVCDFWPKLEVFDQVCTFLVEKSYIYTYFML